MNFSKHICETCGTSFYANCPVCYEKAAIAKQNLTKPIPGPVAKKPRKRRLSTNQEILDLYTGGE